MKTTQKYFYALAFVDIAVIDVSPNREGILKTACRYLSAETCKRLTDYDPAQARAVGQICIIKISRRFIEELDKSVFNPCAPWPKPSIYIEGAFDYAPTVEIYIEELAAHISAMEARHYGNAFRTIVE